MRKILFWFLILVFFPAPAFCAQKSSPQKKPETVVKPAQEDKDRPLTLQDCYKLALKQSELVAIDGERIKQAEAHFLQAFGTLLPQVSFSRTNFWENSRLLPSYNKGFDQKFIFRQTLFSGFKEIAGIRGANFEKKQFENQKWRGEQTLFVDVSDAFYLLLETREDLAVLKKIKNTFIERIRDLKTRQKIGKSRVSEIVSTQTQLYSLEAEIEFAKQQEQVARQLLEFLIGKPFDAIVDSKLDFILKTESQYLAEAAFRPDVESAHFAWLADQKRVAVARSGLLPQVNLETDYYAHRSSQPQDSRWSTALTFDIPIFEGTTTYGQIKEAASQARVSELLFQRQGRQAIQEIHDAYISIKAGIAQKITLAKALKSAQHNYYLQLHDYKLNVVNNLDVLTAIQNLGDTQRSFVHASYELKRLYWQLLLAAGEIKPEK